MPRSANASLDSIIEAAVRGVVERTSMAIARTVAARVLEERERRPGPSSKGRRGPRRTSPKRGPEELTRWTANRRARRVPKFVIRDDGRSRH